MEATGYLICRYIKVGRDDLNIFTYLFKIQNGGMDQAGKGDQPGEL